MKSLEWRSLLKDFWCEMEIKIEAVEIVTQDS